MEAIVSARIFFYFAPKGTLFVCKGCVRECALPLCDNHVEDMMLTPSPNCPCGHMEVDHYQGGPQYQRLLLSVPEGYQAMRTTDYHRVSRMLGVPESPFGLWMPFIMIRASNGTSFARLRPAACAAMVYASKALLVDGAPPTAWHRSTVHYSVVYDNDNATWEAGRLRVLGIYLIYTTFL